MSDDNEKNLVFEWLFDTEVFGQANFTFGDGRVFNLYKDYPDGLSDEEKKVFDEANPFWAEHFSSNAKKFNKQ